MQIKYMVLLGVVTIIGYYCGRMVKFARLPSLVGYLLLGVIVGFPGLEILTSKDLHELTFITEITLGFVAFMIGAELSVSYLKRQGIGMVLLVAVESIVTALIVFLGVYAVTRDLPLSVFFGALAPATAPAGTVAVIQENNAKGPLSRTLYTVVGFDDGIAIIIFGFAAAFAKSLLIAETPGGEGFVMESVLSPVIEISLSVIVGAVLGVLLSLSIRSVRNDTDYFLLVAGFVLVASGLAKWWPISIILTNMIIGFVVANTNLKTRMTSVIRQLQPSTPFFFILFFFLAGAHLDLRLITNLGFIGIAYILCRTLGKFIGARLGAEAGGMSDIVKKYLGIGILSQAGVAIGLSLVVRHELTMIGTPHAELIGSMVITSITATSIVFEIIGPILTRIALDKAGEINSEN